MDALGRRHGPKKSNARELIEKSWSLPTRVEQRAKKGDNKRDPITAFQAMDEMTLMTRDPRHRAPRAIMKRSTESQDPIPARAEEARPTEQEAEI
jgi:hypothetical protein